MNKEKASQAVEIQSSEETNIEVDAEITEAQAAAEIFDQDIQAAGAVLQDLRAFEQTAAPKERKQTQSLMHEVSSALKTLYQKIRRPLMAAPFVLAGGYAVHANLNKKEAVHYADSQHLDRSKLPGNLAFVDTYISNDLVDTYNKCVDFLQVRKNGKMSQEEIDFKEQIAQNIRPFEYGIPVASDLERLHQIHANEKNYSTEAVLKGLKNPTKKLIKTEVEAGKRSLGIRVDLFRKYLGLDQLSSTVQSSEYKPAEAKDEKAMYYKFDTEKLVQSIFVPSRIDRKESGELMPKTKIFEGSTFDDLVTFVTNNKKIPANDFTWQLGEYKAYVGFDKDKNEMYVSYYDLWDLDPPQLKTLGIDIDQFNFPFEVYGRIYKSDFDKAASGVEKK